MANVNLVMCIRSFGAVSAWQAVPKFFLFACLLAVGVGCETAQKTWETVPTDVSIVGEFQQMPDIWQEKNFSHALSTLHQPPQSILVSAKNLTDSACFVARLSVTDNAYKSWLAQQKNCKQQTEGIAECTFSKNKKLYLYAHRQVLFVSASQKEITEQQRFAEKKVPSFREVNPSLFAFSSLQSDSINLYVNGVSTSSWSLPDALKNIPWLSSYKVDAILDVSKTNDWISLTGFSPLPPEEEIKIPVQGQQPIVTSVWRYVPESASWFIGYGFTNTDLFFQHIPQYPTLCRRELVSFSIQDKAAVAFSFDTFSTNWLSPADTISLQTDLKIIPLTLPSDGKWLVRFAPATPLHYGMKYQAVLFFAEHEETLLHIKTAIEQDAVWGKNRNFLQVHERNLQEANFTLVTRGTRAQQNNLNRLLSLPNQPDDWHVFQLSLLDDS